jgi:hypothetical protein
MVVDEKPGFTHEAFDEIKKKKSCFNSSLLKFSN